MENHDDLDAVHRLREAFLQITHELSKVVIGQKQVIEELLVAMFARGHCLLVKPADRICARLTWSR